MLLKSTLSGRDKRTRDFHEESELEVQLNSILVDDLRKPDNLCDPLNLRSHSNPSALRPEPECQPRSNIKQQVVLETYEILGI